MGEKVPKKMNLKEIGIEKIILIDGTDRSK